MVLTTGNGVNGFTLDQNIGEFVLTHPGMTIPEDPREFNAQSANETLEVTDIDDCWAKHDIEKIIDLSKSAAEVLDFIETGIAVKTKGDKLIVVQIFGRSINKPIPLENTIKGQISENLILYINLNNNSKSNLKKMNYLI